MIRFDHFMAQANLAYYASENPFADFVTAPQMTQVFGELLGAWAQIVWQMMGSPENLIIAEAGPGTGKLMGDMVRVFPDLDVHFIETSPRLRALQAARVPRASWHDSLETVPDQPMILFGNEFLDALPVRQFVRRDTGWKERYVADGAYVEVDSDFRSDDPVGSVRECCPAAQQIVADLARRGAVALFIDYGAATGQPAATVQAIHNGKFANPLENPGSADITAHVDFARLGKTAAIAGAAMQGPVKQNHFLTALGLFQRTGRLAQEHPEMAEDLMLAARRLTAPEAMGSLFKVVAICPPDMPPLPGFEP